jgi:hypothetical protein
MNKHIKIFRLLDLLFLFPALVTLGLAYHVHVAGDSVQGTVLMFVVGAVFLAIYLTVLITRFIYASKVDYVTKHNIAVVQNGYAAMEGEFTEQTEASINSWAQKVPTYKKDAGEVLKESDLIVVFKPFPFKIGSLAKLFYGVTMGSFIGVGYRDPLSRTALQHELNHVIYHDWKGNWNQKEHHDFFKQQAIR